MDLTLFILTVVVLFGFYYAYVYLEILRDELRAATGNTKKENTFNAMIDKATNGLTYLKYFI